MERKKILIAIPSNVGRAVYPVPFANSLILACRNIPKNPYDIDIHTFGGLRIDSVRNVAAMYAKKNKYNAMIFLDDDNVFPEDTLSKLLKHWSDGKQIVSGVYSSKAPPYHSFIYPMHQDDFPDDHPVVNDDDIKTDWLRKYDNTKIYEVKAIATGCLIIDMKVFDKLPMPWFLLRMDKTGTQLTCTEDCYFGITCVRVGIKMYVDASIECQHLKLVAFPNFFNDPNIHYDGEWRKKINPQGIPRSNGPMIIHPAEDFFWQDGIDQCPHQHQYPVPVNEGEEQLYRCLDCGLVSNGEDLPGSNILDKRVMSPKILKDQLDIMDNMELI